MMDELIKQIVAKTGISEAQAKQAIEMTLDFLKEKLPEPMAGQVDAVLSGDTSGLGGLASGLGGMFGKKK
jgi:uncharacterized protein (DUF2267 family)